MEMQETIDGLLIVMSGGRRDVPERDMAVDKDDFFTPGDIFDKQSIPLLKEDETRFYELGKALAEGRFKFHEFSNFISAHSDYMRDFQAHEAFFRHLKESGKLPEGFLIRTGEANKDAEGIKTNAIQLGIGNYNWSHRKLPEASEWSKHPDEAVEKLLKNCYFANHPEEGLPSMSWYSEGLLKTIVNTVEAMRDGHVYGENSLGAIVTQMPIIDTSTVFLKSLVERVGKGARFNAKGFKEVGAYRNGEMLIGEIHNLEAEDPDITFHMRATSDFFKEGYVPRIHPMGTHLDYLTQKLEEVQDHAKVMKWLEK